MDGISTLKTFLSVHKPQLLLSNVPERYWPTLCKKLTDQIFDAGSCFTLLQIDYENLKRRPFDPLWGVQALKDIQTSDETHIYLIDHAWTFRVESIRSQLRNVPGLLERMCNLLQIDEDNNEQKIEQVSQGIWKYAQTYAVGGTGVSFEDQVPLWYIMDELGSGIQHSDDPNFRTVPFIHVPEQLTYTLLFPIKHLEAGDLVTRNFVEGSNEDVLQRKAMLLPWQQYQHFDESFNQEEPEKEYFLSGHIVESVAVAQVTYNVAVNKRLKVYSEYDIINQNLTCDRFEIVNNEEDADILWFMNHFKKFKELSELAPHKFINQFPFEYVITIKDLLAIVARRGCADYLADDTTLQTHPMWLPTTFNLKTELPKLVSYFKRRQDAGLDNYWICKPFNLARGLDTYITDNLDFLCRLPLTGPKIAQKYIENPVLFDREHIGPVKFDVRYVILLKSVNPTKVYVYKNFFLRFANKPFSLTNFDDYEQHFTVMNYNENTPLYKMLCADYKYEWAIQFPNISWDTVEENIFDMITEFFKCATMKEPPCGIGQNSQSRALYAADIMLEWQMHCGKNKVQPKLLEINWMPDCKRACEYYPDFYNDIFSTLFLDQDVETCKRVL